MNPALRRFLVSFAATLVVGGTGLVLADRALSSASAATAEKGVVVVRGSSTVGELAGPLTNALQAIRPDLTIRYETTSSSAGIGALVRGEIELAASSRPASEAEKLAAEGSGRGLVEHVVARDGIAVVVHPDNPVTSLTLEQLRAILTGRIASWSELGGRPARINVLLRPPEQGSHEVLKAAVLDHGEVYATGAEVVRRTEDVAERVRLDPNAIGYVTFLATGATKALRLTAGSVNAVPPTPATIRSGAYPLRRDLFVISRREPSPSARAVLGFLLGPGQDVVREAGFVTLE